jgi:CheY-like chemotaxis protein
VLNGPEPRVVVVDDGPKLLACIAAILTEENYQVFAALSAGEARERLRMHRAEVVLCSVKMPHPAGLKLVAWMDADPTLASIPIIIFTSAGAELRKRVPCVFDFLPKPVSRAVLVARVFATVCMSPASIFEIDEIRIPATWTGAWLLPTCGGRRTRAPLAASPRCPT